MASSEIPMTFDPPETFNIADYFLDARLRQGNPHATALLTTEGDFSYQDVYELANRFGQVLWSAGVEPQQRVIIALPDGPEFVAALFGILKIGAVVVMVNPHLKPDAITYFYEYTGAQVAIVHQDTRAPFEAAARDASHVKSILVVGGKDFQRLLSSEPSSLETFPTRRDDAAIWLFSGGTTGRPKAVLQTHRSFANTTECYAKQVIQYRPSDITLSVPKLFFGYATGSNLFFPFAVGATAALFSERATADAMFSYITRFRPTILVNVPTMISQMLNHPDAATQDLSSVRVATSAGEALPVELHRRWQETFGVELLDGLGTAEMWHIFISNRPGAVKPGTLGTVVPGFEVKVCDDGGAEVPHDTVGWLRVRGQSRAIGYWQEPEKTASAFQGEWYVSGDMVRCDADGYFTYAGRGDDMLKVSGKWLSPQEVENCLLQHPSVEEAAVVGVVDVHGLTVPHAFIVPVEARPELDRELQAFVRERLETYKHPRTIVLLDTLPRTHLGKVDRARLRETTS
jgi:benzoate-CoA ligase family protein